MGHCLRKILVILIILLAVVTATLGVSLSPANLPPVVAIANFFDIMLPILAVGALINYLWKSCACPKSTCTLCGCCLAKSGGVATMTGCSKENMTIGCSKEKD